MEICKNVHKITNLHSGIYEYCWLLAIFTLLHIEIQKRTPRLCTEFMHEDAMMEKKLMGLLRTRTKQIGQVELLLQCELLFN